MFRSMIQSLAIALLLPLLGFPDHEVGPTILVLLDVLWLQYFFLESYFCWEKKSETMALSPHFF